MVSDLNGTGKSTEGFKGGARGDISANILRFHSCTVTYLVVFGKEASCVESST